MNLVTVSNHVDQINILIMILEIVLDAVLVSNLVLKMQLLNAKEPILLMNLTMCAINVLIKSSIMTLTKVNAWIVLLEYHAVLFQILAL